MNKLKTFTLFLKVHFLIFLAQQWKITSDGKLKNKLRSWSYNAKIPKDGKLGRIRITNKRGPKKFLTLNITKSYEVQYDKRYNDETKKLQAYFIRSCFFTDSQCFNYSCNIGGSFISVKWPSILHKLFHIC